MTPRDGDPFSFLSNLRKELKSVDRLKEGLEKGKSAQELLRISSKEMHLLEEAAERLLHGKRSLDAGNAYLFLATLNPTVEAYWIGFGLSLSEMGDYRSAKDAFELATLCSDKSPLPYFYLAKLLLTLHDREATLEALNLTIELAGDRPLYRKMKREAQKAKKLLEA